MSTNFINTVPRSTSLLMKYQSGIDHPKIQITSKKIEEQRQEYLDIRDDHKSAHFNIGGSQGKLEPLCLGYGDTAYAKVAYKQ